MLYIEAYDPGGTTGVAAVAFDEKDPTEIDAQQFQTWQIGPQEHHHELWLGLTERKPQAVVCERFIYQRRELDRGVSLVLDSVEYIGIIKLFGVLHHVPVIIQTPAQAKNLWDDTKLKTLGLYTPSAPHANDAMRHLLYYLVVTLNRREMVMKLKPQ